MYFKKDASYLILDIESNSAANKEQRRITQFAALVVCNDTIKEVSILNRNVNYIPQFVAKMTHLDVTKCKQEGLTEKKMINQIYDLVTNSKRVYAYGMSLDYELINEMFKKYGLKKPNTEWFDVINDVSKYLSPSKLKLSYASKEYGFNDTKYHDALVDCYATYHLMNVITNIREAME